MGTKLSEIWVKMQSFSLKKISLKISTNGSHFVLAGVSIKSILIKHWIHTIKQYSVDFLWGLEVYLTLSLMIWLVLTKEVISGCQIADIWLSLRNKYLTPPHHPPPGCKVFPMKCAYGLVLVYFIWIKIHLCQISRSHMTKKMTIFTRIEHFWTVTPVWIHQWLRNDAQSLM